MNYKKTNNITGWVICAIACIVYISTAEAGGSLWDCGEFISCCFKVQIPHPPGAPLFVMIGRLFIVLFGDNPLTAAKAVNIMSALASGFTILFLFWSITHFARKLVRQSAEASLTTIQVLIVMGAGATGALAYAFSDSFWYSAVEGEVYALSSFFTAIVFWCILKWEEQADEPGADRWIVFIFFLIGMSIGVHLLSILNIPTIIMIYYFRKRSSIPYQRVRKYFIRILIVGGILAVIGSLMAAQNEASSGIPFDGTVAGLMLFGTLAVVGLLYLFEYIGKAKKEQYGGVYIFLLGGCALELFVQIGVIQYSIKAASVFDRIFVNSFNLPFFTGFTVFFILLAAGIYLALRYAGKKNWRLLTLALWCFVFILIGYSPYVTTMLRSNADPGIDMFNVDNPITLEGYLNREQYGDFPLLYGQNFTARPIDYKETSTRYVKSRNRYIDGGKKGYNVFAKEDKMIFPRMWDMGNDQGHADYYAQFLGARKLQDGTYDFEKDADGHSLRPNFTDNLSYYLSYQNYYMYVRYFLWNFSGKQNDNQGLFNNNVRDGNWITGIAPVDNALYGDQSAMPNSLKKNKAHNTLFALPLLLGLIGMLYQYKKDSGHAIAITLLFLITGVGIVVYINQSGMQPRERDYAYVGSFFAFAIWIGLSVTYFAEVALSRSKQLIKRMLSSGAAFFITVLVLFILVGLQFPAALITSVILLLLYALLTAGLPYLLNMFQSPKAIIATTLLICLLVPALMVQQEWDDHDRSNKQTARDLARNILESCAPNAILFTFADNDTYPLWYAQEVEGIRPDVRIVITTLLGTDWRMNQLRYKMNESAPIDIIWNEQQIEGDKRSVAFYQPSAQFPQNTYYDLYDVMKNYLGDDTHADSRGYLNLPVNKFSIPVDEKTVRANGTVNTTDSIVSEVRFQLPKNVLYKNDLAMLNIIAANKWQRPIYFTGAYDELGLTAYLRRDGMAYRLVPVPNSFANTDHMLDVVMNKFSSGNAQIPGVYFDEENRRHLKAIRKTMAELAFDLSYQNRKAEAVKVLQKADNLFDEANFPYGITSRGNDHNHTSLLFLQACYQAGELTIAKKVTASLQADLQQQEKYYNTLTEEQKVQMYYDIQETNKMLADLAQSGKR